MILDSVRDARNINSVTLNEKLKVVGVRDYYYNMNSWLAEVQAKTDQFIEYGDTVALLGHYKDGSSFYLNHFPQWEFVSIPHSPNRHISSTAYRKMLFRESFLPDWEGKTTDEKWEQIKPIVDGFGLPGPVTEFLYGWTKTPEYVDMTREYEFITEYKGSWANAPYPPTFVCTDAIVVCSGHVLVVTRKFNPGKGLYALPGGFLRQTEDIQSGMLRELKEETGIRVDKLILESSIKSSKVFDHPDRSLRGRTISHGFYIKLRDGKLPEIKANDDASAVQWMPLIDVAKNENKFFEDHSSIIHHFINQS